MPLISVVIPIYNVEPYLEACLQSVAEQTVGDLEVIMVDDGSSDGSATIAEQFAARDKRFRLISQANGGLGKARNTGLEAATGEFLAFVDSDDVLPRNAYELLHGSLEKTRSDFATGNVHRLTSFGTTQSPFLAKTFAETRLKTHVMKLQALITDRIVPNKLWRRTFWDAHGFRFPEGVLNEDIPVVVPAQFAARSVDVIAEPVYYYRIRQEGDLSITERRLEPTALIARVDAIEYASDHLGREGLRKAKRWYHKSVVADDLSYYLNVLDRADDDYHALFLDRVNAFLDGASPRIYDRLPAIERLKWHLVRRRLMPELLEVLRFQKEELNDTPPVRERGKWYGDYPFRTDEQLRIPRSVYRLEGDFGFTTRVEDLSWDGNELQLRGYAYIDGIGASSREAQQVTVSALRPGRFRRIRLRTSAVRWKTSATHRPDVRATARQPWCDVGWSGFVASLDPSKLSRLGRWRLGTWELYVTVRASGVRRRRSRFGYDIARPLQAVDIPLTKGAAVRAEPTPEGGITVDVLKHWAAIQTHRLNSDTVELEGHLGASRAAGLTLRIRSSSGSRALEYPLTIEGDSSPAKFSVRVPLADLGAQVENQNGRAGSEKEGEAAWEFHVMDDGRREPLAVASDVPEALSSFAGREFCLYRTQSGHAALVARAPRPIVSEASWTEEGVLELAGDLRTTDRPGEVVLLARRSRERQVFPIQPGGPSGRFEIRLTPAHVESLAGVLPLREDTWDIYVRLAGEDGEAAMTPLLLAQSLRGQLPLRTVVEHKPFTLGATPEQQAVLIVRRDLDDDEQGRFHQHRLRATAYAPNRAEPLRDAVVYSSFGGRQYSDSPRAIHEELVHRGAPLEHLWVVRDAMCRVPESAKVLREGSAAYHQALGRARFIVTNDHLPSWFTRRPDQVCLQTWHGTPLKRLGLDVPQGRRTLRRTQRRWSEEVANWQYFVSPNKFSTPILRRAYAIEGEMLETGYPRDDVLARPDREVLTRKLRRRLGLPDDARVLLYAPTYRDHVFDRQGGYRLDLRLDLDRLRDALGRDTVILFRKHHYVADAVPVTADGFVRDVSSYPDGTELLLAADVLVTDYSSIMFDFANTRRPMLFFTYDLEAYRDENRGFYFDFTRKAPGPLLRTTDELAEALCDIDAVGAEYSERYSDFVSTFCELDDGHAAARVVDRLFSL